MKASILVLLLVFLPISGCINSTENKDNKNNEIHTNSCTYSIEIKVRNKGYFLIEVPIAINSDGGINEIMNDLKIIEGTGNYSVANSSRGKSLLVSANNDIRIENVISGNWLTDNYPILSMRNISVYEYIYQYFIFLHNITNNNYISISMFLSTYFSNGISVKHYKFSIIDYISIPIGEKIVNGTFDIIKT